MENVIVRGATERSTPSAPSRCRALLMCKKCRKPTSHRFIVTRGVGMGAAYEHVFACSVEGCNTERRYGLCG